MCVCVYACTYMCETTSTIHMKQLQKCRCPRPTPKPKTWMMDLSPEGCPVNHENTQEIRSIFKTELYYNKDSNNISYFDSAIHISITTIYTLVQTYVSNQNQFIQFMYIVNHIDINILFSFEIYSYKNHRLSLYKFSISRRLYEDYNNDIPCTV